MICFLFNEIQFILKSNKMNTIKDLIMFFIYRKKYFLIPLLIVLFLIAGTLILVQGTVIAPFIYTVF